MIRCILHLRFVVCRHSDDNIHTCLSMEIIQVFYRKKHFFEIHNCCLERKERFIEARTATHCQVRLLMLVLLDVASGERLIVCCAAWHLS